MERKPSTPFAFENGPDGDDSTEATTGSKKKTAAFRLPLALTNPGVLPESFIKKAALEQSLETLDNPELPKKSKKSKNKPSTEMPEVVTEAPEESVAEKAHVESAESEPEVLESEEVEQALVDIAADHLATIELANDEDQEALAPATNFLERVHTGVDPESAFWEVVSDAELYELVMPDSTQAEQLPTDVPIALPLTEEAPILINTPEVAQHEVTPSVVAVREVAPMPQSLERHYAGRAPASQLLIAGIVGHVLGKRHGRIKSEKKLLPVQRALEVQVATLEQEITQKERLLVAAKAAQNKAPELRQRQQPSRVETRLEVQKPERATNLGKLIVAAESPVRMHEAEKVRTMKRAELLKVSEKITVDGANLRKVYESKLISEDQLRHLVIEHTRGKNIAPALQREMLEKQLDFERDPMLRGRAHSYVEGEENVLGRLLEKAGVVHESDNGDDQNTSTAARRPGKQSPHRVRQQRAAADVVMVTTIVVLATLVVVLLLTR